MVGKLFIISAPSGAGKTTLIYELIKRYSSQYNLDRVITYTSRLPRSGEINGRDYHFIDTNEFELRIKEGFFLEHSSEYGTYYGSPVSLLDTLQQGVSLLLIIDTRGAQELTQKVAGAISIWLYADMALLQKRLLLRNTETQEEIDYRLALAQKEINQKNINDFYQYHIFNDDIQKSLQQFEEILSTHLKDRIY